MAKARHAPFSYWSLVEPVWLPLNRSWDDGPEEFVRRFRSIRPEIAHLYAAHWCQSEVCNGGLHQFFSNTTGLLAPEALEGFRAIGASEWAEILAEAMKVFHDTNYTPNPTKVMQVVRWAVLGWIGLFVFMLAFVSGESSHDAAAIRTYARRRRLYVILFGVSVLALLLLIRYLQTK